MDKNLFPDAPQAPEGALKPAPPELTQEELDRIDAARKAEKETED